MLSRITRSQIAKFCTGALNVVHDVAKKQFRVELSNELATLTYTQSGKNITFHSTEVPQIFQGRGIGKHLAKEAFDYAFQKKLDVLIKCHFLQKFINENKQLYPNLKYKFTK